MFLPPVVTSIVQSFCHVAHVEKKRNPESECINLYPVCEINAENYTILRQSIGIYYHSEDIKFLLKSVGSSRVGPVARLPR